MVRKATLQDIDAIKKIADKYIKEIGFVLKPALEESCKKGTLLVYECENIVVGFCNYHHRRDGINVIYEICVSDNFRHKGIAKELINNIPKPIRLKCPVDNESNNFYKHIGAKLVEIVPGKKRDLNVYEIGDIYAIGLFS
mgnify:CR=1 FL=1